MLHNKFPFIKMFCSLILHRIIVETFGVKKYAYQLLNDTAHSVMMIFNCRQYDDF